MPSPKTPVPRHDHFIPFLITTGIIWLIYRSLFQFPVWFDEVVGKAIFFGLPIWVYIQVGRSKTIPDTFSVQKLHAGLLRGIAIGGLFGFVGVLMALLRSPGVQTAWVFTADYFWWEFFLALMTGFWETLFFFSWIMTAIQEKYRRWSLLRQVLVVALIFMVFHIPNSILRFSGSTIVYQICLMFLFALGQALVFSRWRNGYTLTLSHAIWGMILLIHFT